MISLTLSSCKGAVVQGGDGETREVSSPGTHLSRDWELHLSLPSSPTLLLDSPGEMDVMSQGKLCQQESSWSQLQECCRMALDTQS